MGFRYGAPEHPEFMTASFICAIIILLPISSHWKARNVATLSMIAWLFVVNMYRFVNAIVWANNVDIIPSLNVWCDITTKLTVGATIALPAAALCICRYLEAVASVRWARQTDAQKRNRKLFELFMCFGLPMIFMALHYISQGHRYDIYEHMGCQTAVVRTWVAVLTLYIPPLILSLISFGYAGCAIRHFYRRRVDFKKHLSQSNAGISANRYVRLMLLAVTEMVFDTAINIYVIWFNTTQWGGLVPYTSWADIHYNFSRVAPLPLQILPPAFWKQIVFLWWIIPIATILFWSFFAFGQESIQEYKSWWNWFQRKILRRDIPRLGDSSVRVGAQRLPTSNNSSTTITANNSSSKSGWKGFKAPRISIPIPSARKGRKIDDDASSFASADSMHEKKGQLSPLSPATLTGIPPPMKGDYMDQDLDTSVFDTISHVTIPDHDENDFMPSPTSTPSTTNSTTRVNHTAQPSMTLGPYHPYLHSTVNGSATTFENTGVRPNSPNVHTNGVHVKTEISTDMV